MNLEIVNKHALIRESDGYILVDTGSPVTIERQGQSLSDMLGGLMASLGMGNDLQSQVLGQLGSVRGQALAAGLGLAEGQPLIDLDEVSRKVGVRVKKLLGTDGMSNGPMLIDYAGGRIEFGRTADDAAFELPCRMLAGIPVVTITIAGAERQMFIDTGAPTSYISSSMTRGMAAAGTIRDFHPRVGDFDVKLFELETTIASWSGQIAYGNLPPALAEYEKVGCDGIIGYDLFSRFAVTLDVDAGRVWLK